jgi:hypothetical protein
MSGAHQWYPNRFDSKAVLVVLKPSPRPGCPVVACFGVELCQSITHVSPRVSVR